MVKKDGDDNLKKIIAAVCGTNTINFPIWIYTESESSYNADI